MNEKLFQYIWQFQYFNTSELKTTTGEAVQIINAGRPNIDQGPDFENACIRIGNTTWAGSVEHHLKTSDWLRHSHQSDKNYKKVIMHVVYEHDREVNEIPVIELKDRISRGLLSRYNELMKTQTFIPCERLINEVPEIILNVWKGRLVAERLIRKALLIQQYQQDNKDHWEESFWWMLARNFGLPVNGDAFEAVAKSIPVNLLAKHKNQVQQLEALMFGQAGLLNSEFDEAYPKMLRKEYAFLKKKYNLVPSPVSVKFLRMRPGSFPTLRLAQLAAVVNQSNHLFSRILEEPSLKTVKTWFQKDANDFWHYHYSFDQKSSYKVKSIGAAMIDNIIINTITPILFSYGSFYNKNELRERALGWLEEIAAEKNAITKGFQNLGLSNKTALDSQAFLELKKQYCNEHRCLQCSVGNALLKQKNRST